MAVNVKLGVDLSGFNSGIREGQGILKGLNAEMKATEAEFKATGNAEQMLTNKTKVLSQQIRVQKGIATEAEKALKAMTDAGVDPANAAYQKLYATMMNATAGMNNAQAELNALGASAQDAAAGADQLTTSVQGIGKKISLEQVISGIDKITGGLERAAQKAIQLGEELWNTIMDSARRADDTATMAERYNIPLEQFLKMQRLVGSGMDTTVDSMLSAQDKLNKGVGKGTKATIEALEELRIQYRVLAGDEGIGEYMNKDYVELFWEAGQALMKMSDAYDKEAAAQALFGKSWKELRPLFDTYKSLEEYNKALDEMTVNDEETIRDLAALNDAVSNLENSWTVLKDEVLGALAPALKSGADSISGLLDSLTTYLKKEDGQKLLENLGTAVSGLFEDLSKIDPQDVISGFSEVFTTIVGGVQWIVENSGTVISALEAIVIGWGALKLTGGALEIVKLVQGISSLTGAGAAEAGAAAGSSWGASFASAVAAAAPWLIGLYTLLNPAGSAGNNIDTLYQNGLVTEAGMQFWNNNMDQWYARQLAVANRYGDLSSLMGNTTALSIMLDPTISDTDMFKQLEEKIGVKPVDVNANVVVPGDTAAQISEQVGTVVINGVIHFVDENGNNIGVDFGEKGTPTGTKRDRPQALQGDHANGLAYVPYDGYLARLHKGERVMTAREVQSRSYNSNLYVESMIMNNGTDAAGLASAMAAAQQRTMIGFGS